MLGHEFEKATKKDKELESKMLEHIRSHKKFKMILEEIADKEQ